MPIGKNNIDKSIKENLEKYAKAGFEYDPPFLFKINEDSKFFLNITSNSLGFINIGGARVKLFEIEKVSKPIFDKYNLNWTDWNSTLQGGNWDENLSMLKTDDEVGLKIAMKKMESYIDNSAIPFWENSTALTEVMKMIESKTEEELNQFVFQGFTGIINRLIIAKQVGINYFNEKSVYYMNLFEKYNQKKPELYGSRLTALKELLETLEE